MIKRIDLEQVAHQQTSMSKGGTTGNTSQSRVVVTEPYFEPYTELVLDRFKPRYAERLLVKSLNLDPVTARLVKELEKMFVPHPNGFARHYESIPDQKNLEGKSWHQILGISRYMFNQHFDKIGKRYNSFAEFYDEPFDWENTPCYWRILNLKDNRRTHYYRNHRLINYYIWGRDMAAEDIGLED